MRMDQINVRYIDLPAKIKGFVKTDSDGNYNVYINVNLGYYEQKKTLDHELKHIKNDDFFNTSDILDVENF